MQKVLSIIICFTLTTAALLSYPGQHAEAGGNDVQLYGHTFTGTSFVWWIDASSSQSLNGALAEAKLHITAAIDRLEVNQEFGIVVYDSTHYSFAPFTVLATAANKAQAIAFVNSINAGGVGCAYNAIVQSLLIADTSQSIHPQIFLFSDGVFSCSLSLPATITALNYSQVPIHGIRVGASGVPDLQTLALQNGGLFIDGVPLVRFLRGDANGSGHFNLTDIVVQLGYILNDESLGCEMALDSNSDGEIDLSDVLFGLSELYSGGTAPSAPYPNCGLIDLSPTLDCIDFGAC